MVRLLVGDAREQLAMLEAESVHTVVTSPPYWGLRDYGTPAQVWGGEPGHSHIWGDQIRRTAGGGQPSSKVRWQHVGKGPSGHPEVDSGRFCECGAWRGDLGVEPTPDLYVEHIVEIFRAVGRVLRRDGTVFLNLGDCYASAWPCQRRNEVGSGSLPDGTRAARPPRLPAGLKEKDLVGIPWMVAFALRADGWYLRSDIIWAKGNPMPASVTDRPTTSHEYLFLLSKQPRYYYDATAIREKGVCPKGTRGAKGSVTRAAAGVNARPPEYKVYNGTRNKRSVWTINTAASGIPHYATFPAALVRPCVLAGTSEKGCCAKCGAPWEREIERTGHVNRREPAHAPRSCATKVDSTGWAPTTRATNQWQPTCSCNAATVPCTVLDLFGGVGTTACVAHLLGRDAISIDLDPASLTHYPTRLAALSKATKPKRVPVEQRTLPAMEEAP